MNHNRRSLKTLSSHSTKGFKDLSKSHNFENHSLIEYPVSEKRIKEERVRKIIEKTCSDQIEIIKKKGKHIQPYKSTKVIREIASNKIESDLGDGAGMRNMISKLAFSLVKMKPSLGFRGYKGKRNKSSSVIKHLIRVQSQNKEGSEEKDHLEIISRNFRREKTTNNRDKEEYPGTDTLGENVRGIRMETEEGKVTLRKAMNYFINQRLKGNSPIDYTSFFIKNNDKYLGKF